MIMYPTTPVYGTDGLNYFPLGQYSLAQAGSRPIRAGNIRNDRGKNNGSGRNNSRGYLGYSAGKATYGRYYSKNNQERVEPNGLDLMTQQTFLNGQAIATSISEQALPPVFKTAPGIPAIPATSALAAGQPFAPAAMAAVPGVPQILPAAAVVPQKSTETVLEEICHRQMWGAPTYQLLTTAAADGRQLFVYKVTIPALANLFPQQPFFQVRDKH